MAFSRTDLCWLHWEASGGVYRYTGGLPIIGSRLAVDGVDAVRTTFQWGAQAAADCYVILNMITDRACGYPDNFCMSMGPGRSGARTFVYTLPTDTILSYQKVIVGPSGLDPSVGTDIGEWIRFLEGARPDSSNPLRVMNGYGVTASLFIEPDVRVVWLSQGLSAPEMRPVCEHEIGAYIDAWLGQARQCRVVTYDGEADPTYTLVLFDGEIRRGNDVGWLSRCYPSLRAAIIDVGDLDEREVELIDTDRVGALLRAVRDGTGVEPVMIAGQSYDGLAVLEAAPRSDLSLDCAVAQSPSLWRGEEQWGVDEGTPTGDLRTGSVRPRRDVYLHLQVGMLEQTMRPVVDDCAQLLQDLGATVEVNRCCGGHDVAWWRKGLARALDERWARP